MSSHLYDELTHLAKGPRQRDWLRDITSTRGVLIGPGEYHLGYTSWQGRDYTNLRTLAMRVLRAGYHVDTINDPDRPARARYRISGATLSNRDRVIACHTPTPEVWARAVLEAVTHAFDDSYYTTWVIETAQRIAPPPEKYSPTREPDTWWFHAPVLAAARDALTVNT